MIDNAGYTALAATDTYQNIGQAGNQWAEFTGYTDAANGESASTRPGWTVGAASGQASHQCQPGGLRHYRQRARSRACSWWVASPTPRTRATTTAGGMLVGHGPRSAPATCRSIASDQLKVTYTVSA